MNKEELYKQAEQSLPEGYVILGWGNTFKRLEADLEYITYSFLHQFWDQIACRYDGDGSNVIYAVKHNSPLVELNNLKVINVTLKEMYEFYSKTLWDISQDLRLDFPNDYESGIGYMLDILGVIAFGNADKIRTAYQEGNTIMLTPNFDEEHTTEVRIYDGKKLLLVVVGDELNY